MNEYIFYTLEGCTYPPKGNKSIENCQVLGTVSADDSKQAYQNIIKENPWIIEYGFDINMAICKQIVTDEIIKSIKLYNEEIEFLTGILNKEQLYKFNVWQKIKMSKEHE